MIKFCLYQSKPRPRRRNVMLYKTQGIIIKSENLGELDRLLTIYTRDFGKILARAKSVRKNQAKLKGHLETFFYSHLMMAPARGVDIVTGAETIESFSFLRQNLSCLAAAYYLAELIDQLIVGPERDADIWRLLLDSFRALNKISGVDENKEAFSIKKVIDNFERGLLGFLGYGSIQKNSAAFIRSLLGEGIKSENFLKRVL